MFSQKETGQSLVEIILTFALAAILLPAILTGLLASRGGQSQQDERLQAVAFLQETQESLRVIREAGWNNIATDGTYYPAITGTTWSLIPGTQVINGFTRSVVIGDVYRNTSGAIVASASGALDNATKQVTVTVSWTAPLLASISTTSYFTRYLNNASFTKTTMNDFSPGITSSTAVSSTTNTLIPNDGQITLSGGGSGNWCQPQNYIVSALTLPKQGNTIIATTGAAFIGTGNGTTGVSFVALNITSPPAPATPSATITGTFSSTVQTNAIYSDGTYAYLATAGSSSQVIILNITKTPYTQIGTISVPSGQAANGVYVDQNNIAYVTSSNMLYTYNLATKTGAHTTPLTSITMWISIGESPLAKQVYVVNNHAYVGTANTLFGLQVFKVGDNGSSLQLVGVSNLTWQQASQGLYVNSSATRAYIAFNSGAGPFSKGFFIVDTSPPDPPSWWPFPNFYSIVGQYNTGTMNPDGMTIVPSNKAIVVGTGGTQQYQVIDISNESTPTLCGGLAISQGITGVAAILEPNANAYSYIITGESKNQFKIILGGVGGGYATSGTYESPIFDASNAAGFNYFTATVAQPALTTIQMQVAVAQPAGNGCSGATYSFVGPSANTNAYFTPIGSSISATIPFQPNGSYQNPGECFRYKTYLTTSNLSQTPIFNDITVNYSP